MEKHSLRTVAPLDMALGISKLPFKITPNMMLDIARRAVNAHSYEELQQIYNTDWNIRISDDQIRMVVNYLGTIVYDHDVLLKNEALLHHKKVDEASLSLRITEPGILYIEMDGSMFNTRKQENGSTWKENKLGAVFNSRDILYRKTKNGKEAHKIMKREYISYAGDADTFKEFLYAMAYRNGLEQAEKVVILSDGAKWIKSFKEDYLAGMDVVHILDYTHMKENIYKFANAFILGTNKRAVWADKLKELVKNGKIDDAIAMAAPFKDKKKPGIPNIHTYLINNRNSVDYPAYIKAGYFIGSGLIESGNKSTMQERLKLPGMRWDIKNAQLVLALKCKYDSGLWDSDVVPLVFNHFGLRQ